MSHYHIRWSGKKVLDWERFGSEPEAEARAGELGRPFETYTIEEYDQACPRCRDVFESEEAHPQVANAALEAGLKPSVKYSWQQAVFDAFTEMRSEYLMGKINAAERAISVRLCDLAPSDMDEQAAIRAALRSLRALLPTQRKPETESDDKKEIA
jgi:hypothetical protein